MKARVLRCLSSWVLLDVPLSESESLLHDCFSVLRDPELFDTAMEAIVNALSQPDSQRWDALICYSRRGQNEGLIRGVFKAKGEDSGISRPAGVAIVTEQAGDVIMLLLMQAWQSPFAPPPESRNETKGAVESGRRKVSKCPKTKDFVLCSRSVTLPCATKHAHTGRPQHVLFSLFKKIL